MDKRKLKIALSLAVLIPCVLYAAGIIAQFIININAWKAAGSDYRISPYSVYLDSELDGAKMV